MQTEICRARSKSGLVTITHWRCHERHAPVPHDRRHASAGLSVRARRSNRMAARSCVACHVKPHRLKIATPMEPHEARHVLVDVRRKANEMWGDMGPLFAGRLEAQPRRARRPMTCQLSVIITSQLLTASAARHAGSEAGAIQKAERQADSDLSPYLKMAAVVWVGGDWP